MGDTRQEKEAKAETVAGVKQTLLKAIATMARKLSLDNNSQDAAAQLATLAGALASLASIPDDA